MSDKEEVMSNGDAELNGTPSGVSIALTAPAKISALKLPPIALTPGKGAKAGAKSAFAKESPLSKPLIGSSSQPVFPADAKTSPAVAQEKSPRPEPKATPAPTTQPTPIEQTPTKKAPVEPASVAEKPAAIAAAAPAAATPAPAAASVTPTKQAPEPAAAAVTPAPASKQPIAEAGDSKETPSNKQEKEKKEKEMEAFQTPLVKPQRHSSVHSPAPVPSGSSKQPPPLTAAQIAAEEKAKQMLRYKATVESFGENQYFVGLMAVLTIWALFNSDIQFAATNKDSDLGFEVVISIAFFLFMLEIGMACFYKEDYFCQPDWAAKEDEEWYETWYRRTQWGSFYFWLDLIATVSLILEIEWILQGTYNTVNGGATQSAEAGQATTSGARAGRVVRLVRMVRLVRLIKLYKYSAIKRKPEASTLTEGDTEEAPAESRVGAAMSDLTNRRVIVLILLMLIVIPQLTVNDADISLTLGVQFVHSLGKLNATDPATYSAGLELAIQTVQNELPLIYMNLNGNEVYNDHSRYNSLRAVERATFELNDDNFRTLVSYDQKDVSVQNALFSIYTTSFIIVLLVGGTYFFLSDVNRLVIGPIERLVELVRKISANPLGVEYKVLGAEDGFLEGLETTVLLTTITKIGALMRVGFGEAGASVIAKNLAESSGGRLNLMGSGTMIQSIFGFCDVRQFTDATECLQEEVMLFVNRIAHILHSIVVQCSGAANKNIGDAFLLTWKLDEKMTPAQKANLADQALLAFCKSLIELSRYQEFIVNFSVAATARLYKRFPEYNVRIGSGLHVGWAIEGAIGSHRKIDASYLSPHVNNTEYLESSTKQYGVPLLLSEPFFKLLSPAAAKYCRQVDRIRRSEFEQPMGLYTYDSDLDIDWNDYGRHLKFNVKNKLMMKVHQARTKNALAMAKETAAMRAAAQEHIPVGNQVPHHSAGGPAPALNRNRRQSALSRLVGFTAPVSIPEPIDEEKAAEIKKQEFRERQKKETPTVVVNKYTEEVWVKDQDIIDLRHKVNDSFRALWENGINAYIKGDWRKARDIFHETMRLSKRKDGPSKFIMEIIDEHGGTAPQDWPGYRADY